jgi:plasmid stabilization system protein ParE
LVQDRLDLISESPEAFAMIHKDIRAVRVRTFPYVILYRIDRDAVSIVGIVHGASNQENWFERAE